MASKFVFCLCVCAFVNSVFDLPIANGYTLTAYAQSNITRYKRQGACDGFTCTTTKECISDDKRCDGIVDCTDGSDEFRDCKDIKCPGYLFTCDYGACIDADKKCNGEKDCRDNSDENNCIDKHKAAEHVTSNCKSDQFECKSGQCISFDDKCNGVHDCDDKSDETKAACLNIQCPGYTYKCDYGACVNGFAKCDGNKDCVDNSDEDGCQPVTPIVTPPPVVTSAPPSQDGVCVLPNKPANGKWFLPINKATTLKPGTKVGTSTLLQFECDPGYKLSEENAYLACLPEGWNKNPPSCVKVCPTLYSDDITKVSCFDEKRIEIKCSEATDGSYVKYECATYYESSDPSSRRYCVKGNWNLPPPQCVPVCGEKRVTAVPLIIKGQKVERGNYPWIVALYIKDTDTGVFENSCGGSMLSQKVILTAAHCVTNDYGDPEPVADFKIAVGKYFNKYGDTRDTEAQYSDIEKILVHEKYRGDSRRYASDIAFLITKDKLAFSKVVQPVCYRNLDSMNLVANSMGIVAGWGYTTAGGDPSDDLEEVLVPYKDDATCSRELPPEWADKYLTYDKFCAGYYNQSIAVCQGDSGSGLVFKGSNGRYFVHGIVSLARQVTAGCDVQVSALYTRVSMHYEWLESVVVKYTT